jgi:glycosyltransferase involved in cell wall biosynthesis
VRILYLHKFDLGHGWGGSASILLALHAALTGLGHRVEVVSARRPDPFGLTSYALSFACTLTFGPEKRAGETAIDELSTETLVGMAAAAAAKIACKSFGAGLPDLLVANHINLMALVCQHLHRQFGVPYRIISHGTDTQLLLRDQRYRDLFGAAARDADRIFTMSAFVAREVKATVGGRIEVLGGAIDPGLFFPSPTPTYDDRRLIFLGRLVTEKGIWVLLDAIARQQSARELVLLGEGPLHDEVQAFVARARLDCKVGLVDYVPQSQLREQIVQAAAVVVPSIWQEPLGLVVLEAFACGLPVIASAVGGIPEMVRDGYNGLLVAENDPSVLGTAIDRLLGNQAFYRQVRLNVRNTVVPTYRDLALRLIAR